jgi:hypothetical protein
MTRSTCCAPDPPPPEPSGSLEGPRAPAFTELRIEQIRQPGGPNGGCEHRWAPAHGRAGPHQASVRSSTPTRIAESFGPDPRAAPPLEERGYRSKTALDGHRALPSYAGLRCYAARKGRATRHDDIDYVVVREGKNLKGRLLGLVLRTVGKRRLDTAFVHSVKAVEARNYETAMWTTRIGI